MKLRLDWLNNPYPIILVAVMALGAAIVSSSPSDEPASTRDPEQAHAGDDRPDELTAFLIARGWEEPPSPGDLTPARSRARR